MLHALPRLLAYSGNLQILSFINCPLSRAHSAYWVVDLARFSRKAGWGCTGPPLGLGGGDGSEREGEGAAAVVDHREHQSRPLEWAPMLLLSAQSR